LSGRVNEDAGTSPRARADRKVTGSASMIAVRLIRLARYLWPIPWTALGLLLGLGATLFGATMKVRCGAVEFSGGRLGKCVSRLPPPFCFTAITFGHVILGIDHPALAAARSHEHVHVRQYERWGPLFIPAYLISSLVQLVKGRNPYRDNWFEREAYAKESSQGTLPTTR
jgi:hypothetical protein